MYCFTMSELPNGKYSNLLIVPAFSNKSFSGKTSPSVKNSYFLTFPDDKAEILAVSFLNCIALCFARFYYQFF